jgi:hypothetical protein
MLTTPRERDDGSNYCAQGSVRQAQPSPKRPCSSQPHRQQLAPKNQPRTQPAHRNPCPDKGVGHRTMGGHDQRTGLTQPNQRTFPGAAQSFSRNHFR